MSTKKTFLKAHPNVPVIIHDMRIIPGECRQGKDSFEGVIYYVPVRIFLEQESVEPVVLYTGELVSSPRYPHHPLEHALYDLRLVGCEDSE